MTEGIIVIEQPLLLVIAPPRVTPRSGLPIEAIVVFFGEGVGGEGNPVAVVHPPKGAREGAYEGPERGEEPDAGDEGDAPFPPVRAIRV